jgi:hypothetical protein
VHRQVQQFQRKFNWTPPAKLTTGIAWMMTMLSINLGWIFFRANSLTQARVMLASMFFPGGCLAHSLSGSLYLLVLGLAAGYSLAVLVSDALDRHSHLDGSTSASGVALMARWRWFWISPLYAIALLFLLIVEFSHGVSTAQFMYGNF